ncbi:YdcF family protein [Sphingobacterium spiritivorum]|uniref:YdcF family protein n=1 Tax=Sphingobacterium spiritivorum TaxID=258 RepID=UPI003DA2E533
MIKGIPDTAILDGPLSTNTVEDFKLSKELISQLNPDILVLITSDFHMQRAGILYRRFIDGLKSCLCQLRPLCQKKN